MPSERSARFLGLISLANRTKMEEYTWEGDQIAVSPVCSRRIVGSMPVLVEFCWRCRNVGGNNYETDDSAGDQRQGQRTGNQPRQAEESRSDSRNPNGRALHAVLRALGRQLPLAPVLLARGLLQYEGRVTSVTSVQTPPSKETIATGRDTTLLYSDRA